jgi:diaminohydroxyphosphoribosylaminopyrimidine deaminase/5-amino-6-(5-phosphoribosylamino)uracil reductase
MATDADIKWMDAAARYAAKFLGTTADNPTVGALIIDEKRGCLISRGVTATGGRPHAETIAIDAAGAAARGATLYVTLEPCHHHGKTPPCVDAVIKAGLSRVVIGQMDRDPRTAGQSIEKLHAANIEVTVLENHATSNELHRSFFKRINTNMPYITAKLAVSADGMVGELNVGNVPITGPEAKIWTHTLRSYVDGIAVGANTARIDQPQLNVRLKGLEARSPKKFVFTRQEQDFDGFTVLPGADLKTSLNQVAAQGINHLMIEGGPNLLNQLVEQRLIDVFFVLQSKRLIGDKGVRASDTATYDAFLEKNNYVCVSTSHLGHDVKKQFVKG